jgi:ABC-2 type transport system permease protein
LTLPYPICVAQFGPLEAGPVVTGYFGMLLQGGAMLAIGLMASAFTENQVVAFFVSLTITMFFFLVDKMLVLLPSGAAGALEWFSFGYHFAPMTRGVIDLRNVVFFLSVMAVCLGITFRSLESRRWS